MTGLRWLAAFLICLWASPIAAQDLSAAKRIIEMFLGRVGAKEYEAAMKIAGDSAAFRLLPKSGVEELVTEGITAMGHREEVAHGSALFEERIYSDTWGYIKYWMKFAEEPVVWTFTMYKPEDEWYITNINITDQLEDFFKRPGE